MSARSTRRAARARTPVPTRRRSPAGWVVLLVVAGALAYSNSFNGVFVGDDTDAIVNNPHVTSLWPLSRALGAPADTTVAGRPVVSLSLAINYASAAPNGLDPWGYHLVNLLLHLVAGVALFGVIRRTVSTPPLENRFAGASTRIAFSVALLWVLHPLQTSAVTYVVQRAESLMGLFLLLTVYCAIRATDTQTARPGWWSAGAIGACALGMGSKEVMVVAPLLVGLWVWTFRREALAERRTTLLLAGLASTWVLLAWLVAMESRTESVGFGLGGWTWWTYLRTQAGVIVHYVRLALLPTTLVFIYDWPPAPSWGAVAPQLAVVVVLAAATMAALLRRHPAGFLGAWFFLILAPSSSVLPIATEVAAEHRMYLPLAALIGLVVPLMFWRLPQTATWLIAVSAIALGTTTYARNHDYRSLEALMQDTVEKRPQNARARVTLGGHLLSLERFSEAETHLRAAVAIPHPSGEDRGMRALAHMYLGSALAAQNKLDEAIPHLEKARGLNPELGEPHAFLGEVYATQGRLVDAAESWDRAAAALPHVPPVLDRAARLHATAADPRARNGALAVHHAERAVEITRGKDWRLLDTLAAAYAESGRFSEAVTTIERAMVSAQDASEPGTAALLAGRLQLYASGRPLRESR
jgi:tetratricopeptide (TPR) repeat protein